MTKVQTDFRGMVSEAAKAGEALMRGMTCDVPLVLYFKPSRGAEPGGLCLVPEGGKVPEGYGRACSDVLGIDRPYEHYSTWVWDHATRLPILPTA